MNLSPRFGVTAATVASLILLAGCQVQAYQPSGTHQPHVITSVYPLEYLADEIGGDQLHVTNITPAGAEPHDLELAPTDIAALTDADLVLTLAGFQPSLDAATAELPGTEVVDVGPAADLLAAGAEHDHADHSEHNEHSELAGLDPHFWLDPVRFAAVADTVADALTRIDPGHAQLYRDNATRLRSELEGLDQDFQAGLASCSTRTIITSHAAFGYLAQRYGLREVSVSGLDPETEPAPVRIHEIASIATEENVGTVFTEPQAPATLADVLGQELQLRVAVLDPLETRAGPSADDFLSISRKNLAALTTALECAP